VIVVSIETAVAQVIENFAENKGQQ
jgi:hypothetical protein